MKDKFITREHFNYANKIIKILGFKSMCDFDNQISYSDLKESQEEICEQVTLTMCKFKELFPLNEFDLRRIKYTFENIDQVIGFFKKMCTYLSIPYEFVRVSKSIQLRLPRSKSFLYNNYIQDMEKRENPQIETLAQGDNTTGLNESIYEPDKFKQLDTVMKISTITSSQILKFKKVQSFEQEFFVGPSFRLDLFTDFKWFNWIKIAMLTTNGQIRPILSGSTIDFSLGYTIAYSDTIDSSTQFDSQGFYTIPIDFFNNQFYPLHFGKIDIKFNAHIQDCCMFKIIVNGNDFTEKLPKSYMGTKTYIECDHDSKYYIIDPHLPTPYTWRIMSGMLGPNYSPQPNLSKCIKIEEIEAKFNEYKASGLVSTVKKSLCLRKEPNDPITPNLYYIYLSKQKLLDDYEQFCIIDFIDIKCSHIKQMHGELIMYYPFDFDNGFYSRAPKGAQIGSIDIEPSDLIEKQDHSLVILGDQTVYIKLKAKPENMYKFLNLKISVTFYVRFVSGSEPVLDPQLSANHI